MKGFEGNQRITMNTSALEAKLAAFKMLAQVSEAMGEQFGPYAEALMPTLIENVSYQFSKKVRSYSLKTLANLVTAMPEP